MSDEKEAPEAPEFHPPIATMPNVPAFGSQRDWFVTQHSESLVLGDSVRGCKLSELTFCCEQSYHNIPRPSDGSFSIYVLLTMYDSSRREQGRWGGESIRVTSLDDARAKAVAWAQSIIGSVARDLNLAAEVES